jgi:multicomponent Na+:H+ antiporter subunit G
MSEALQWIGATLALAGALLTVVGSLGVLRFPDFYTRMHAASITDTGAATLLLLGLVLMAGWSLIALKLVLVWGFLMLTSPTASHALANAAYSSGLWPWVGPFQVTRKDDRSGKGAEL